VIAQGDIWWADLGEPAGSEPGLRRPVVVVQGDAFNRSAIGTVVCVVLTSKLRWAEAPGNVMLAARNSGLPKDSVANVSTSNCTGRARQIGDRSGLVRADSGGGHGDIGFSAISAGAI
jgi:mRNA interferase MazF